jgi:hypothetical protein
VAKQALTMQQSAGWLWKGGGLYVIFRCFLFAAILEMWSPSSTY